MRFSHHHPAHFVLLFIGLFLAFQNDPISFSLVTRALPNSQDEIQISSWLLNLLGIAMIVTAFKKIISFDDKSR